MQRIVLLALFLTSLTVTAGIAQNAPDCSVNQNRGCSVETPTQRMERQNTNSRNKERQESLKKDTDKLLELATELKNQVDKSSENTLSLDVMKKAEEIEKLAKNVREKMKADFMMPGPTIESPLDRPRHR